MKNRRKRLFTYAVSLCILCACGIFWNGIEAAARQANSENISEKTDGENQEGTTEDIDATPKPDRVTLAKTKVNAHLVPVYSYGKSVVYADAETDIAVDIPASLKKYVNKASLPCKSSNKSIQAYASISGKFLHLRLHGNKKCTTKLTVTIAGEPFQIKVNVKTVKISTSSLLLEKGKSKKLKITGCSKGIKWSSSNKKVATVSKDGVVKGKRIGNAVISASINGKKIGCAVSVTTGTLIRVCARATYIGTHWTYSQARRTQYGYYDCSALVWKAYMECAGFSFGNPGYPGTSATESAWCRDNGRMIPGGYTYAKMKKMQLNPGDLVFKSRSLHDPYHTTYHVEMFTGYICLGYLSNGKPNITSLWASRGPGYGAADGSLLARPMK